MDYKYFVHNLAVSGTNRVFLNSDEEKMLSVFVEMFRNSHMIIRLFSGSLSNDVVNTPEYIESLSDFIEKGGKLRVLLNKYDESSVKDTNLFKRLAYYQSEGRDIIVKSTSITFYYGPENSRIPVHFAIGDGVSYRLENDITQRTAICNMNDPITSSRFAASYDKVFNDAESKDICLSSIYDIQK